MNVKEGPWVLSAVCSRWRTIALSQPSLWNGFVLNFTDDPYSLGSAGRILPLVEAHLERSQKLPLNITFSPFHEIECTETEQALLDLLAAHCDRWETVELCGSTLLYDTLIGSIYGHLPILRKLDIRVCSQFEEDDEQELDISDLFAACPALQEVFINGGRYGGDIPPATLPVLDTLSLCFIPLNLYSRNLGDPLDEDRLMRTVEVRLQRGGLRSLRLHATKFVPSAATLERMEALAQGMQIVLYERSDSLYSEMVSPDFQLYTDQFFLYEIGYFRSID
ncbi:hypothetical protein B0H14DRAFT_2858523 [Mycena olivaceomarginata]|nr:hypothetical protein B0H14DRAFT_2858523 [Mycena olivaceomarginata]